MAAASAAGAAAAARIRRMHDEEESMTPYSREDLENDWEFKIVRSVFNSFGNPAKLQQLIEREAQSGWTMVEKFDDQRVRFKRRASDRLRDSMLPAGIDPYDTNFGMGEGKYVLLVFGIIIGVLVFITLIIAAAAAISTSGLL